MTRSRYLSILILLCATFMPTLQGQERAQSTAPTGVVIEGTTLDAAKGVIPGVTVTLAQGKTVLATAITDSKGTFRFLKVLKGQYSLTAALPGFKTVVASITIVTDTGVVPVPITMEVGALTETVNVLAASGVVNTTATVSGLPQSSINISIDGVRSAQNQVVFLPGVAAGDQFFSRMPPRLDSVSQVTVGANEAYAHLPANPFRLTSGEPLSTFAADVDTASYSNVRRFLNQGRLPPSDSVRVEELVNYFHFNYPAPTGAHPIGVTAQIGDCPWAPDHKLALIGVRARPIDERAVGGRNIVLLLDVSGSMADANKLPLVKTAMRMFVDTLRDTDRLAIVTYAGESGVALPSTPARNRERIHDAIDWLQASGSTNGASGIRLAYEIARHEFVPKGVNRVILATDGDFNVGVTSNSELLQLIEKEKASGIFLSVLGVGTGNLKDERMELLADKGNGHYSYLDSLQEARRVLVREGGATLETVAKDVKFQVEFNPATVAAWRLVGYENRVLAHEAFHDDKKDGGEIGAGHTVTVLYEIVPAGGKLPAELTQSDGKPLVDPLIYQTERRPAAGVTADLFTVKIRYKRPDADESTLMTQAVRSGGAAPDLPFAAAVAEFGMLLRTPPSDLARWDGLTARLQKVPVPAMFAAERQSFGELVEIAAGLAKLSAPRAGR